MEDGEEEEEEGDRCLQGTEDRPPRRGLKRDGSGAKLRCARPGGTGLGHSPGSLCSWTPGGAGDPERGWKGGESPDPPPKKKTKPGFIYKHRPLLYVPPVINGLYNCKVKTAPQYLLLHLGGFPALGGVGYFDPCPQRLPSAGEVAPRGGGTQAGVWGFSRPAPHLRGTRRCFQPCSSEMEAQL